MFDLQKASMSKRISAFLADAIAFFILFVGVLLLMSAVTSFDAKTAVYEDMCREFIKQYEEDHPGVQLEPSDEEYEKMTEEQKEQHKLNVEAANKALGENEEIVGKYTELISLIVLNITVGVLVSYLVLDFVIPIFIGNGQTLGKKVFGVALMRTDGVKVSNISLFVRTILGKFTIETMIPVIIFVLMFFGGLGLTGSVAIYGPMIIIAIIAIEIILYIKTGTNSFLHDVMADTVCVDLSCQLIFETEEEMLEAKKEAAAAAAQKQAYYSYSGASNETSQDSITIESQGSTEEAAPAIVPTEITEITEITDIPSYTLAEEIEESESTEAVFETENDAAGDEAEDVSNTKEAPAGNDAEAQNITDAENIEETAEKANNAEKIDSSETEDAADTARNV